MLKLGFCFVSHPVGKCCMPMDTSSWTLHLEVDWLFMIQLAMCESCWQCKEQQVCSLVKRSLH